MIKFLMPAFHVLVEFPNAQRQPWLIFVYAEDANEARRVIEDSSDVKDCGGRVAQVNHATDGTT